jgi:nicotinate-nucleotide pyrophosphorylase (carboxylating)
MRPAAAAEGDDVLKLETIAAPIVNLALTEDLGSGDVTADALVSLSASGRAHIVARKSGIVAGLEVARVAFEKLDPHIDYRSRVKDGDRVEAGDLVGAISGAARALLSAERVALNFLQHLSGIATHTAAFVAAVAGTGVEIRDTRKTTPVLRMLEKYAVQVGGGRNHRFGLYDMVLIKENHLAAAGSIAGAVRRAREHAPGIPIEVEARRLSEAEEAATAGVDWILLDNMTPDEAHEVVERLGVPPAVASATMAPSMPRPAIEASGGITLENARAYAMTGVHALAVGAITHSAPAMDFSMLVDTLSDLA